MCGTTSCVVLFGCYICTANEMCAHMCLCGVFRMAFAMSYKLS